jgi:PadR family transcriptional regulator, regulatory protein PadR
VRRLSIAAVTVLQAVANGTEYGFDIIDSTGLPSGTVYPALSRLERDGYLRSAWEDERDAHEQGRPARRYYRVTAQGSRTLDETVTYYRSLLPLAAARKAGRSS